MKGRSMVLSRRTLKRMENLGSACSFDTDKEIATLNMHFADISELIDDKMSNEAKLVVQQDAIDLLYDGLELVPVEFRVNYNISIDDWRGYDLKTVEEAFEQAIADRDYKANTGKAQKHSVMCIFVVLGLVFLLIGNYTTKNNMFDWAGLSFSAIIAFVLELMFEVYFEEGASHFIVSRIYDKLGYSNRFGTVSVRKAVTKE